MVTRKYTYHHVMTFLLTFFCFSLYHASRKAFSNVKDSLSKEWSPTTCNASWPCPSPPKNWSSHSLFESYKAAEPFLGNLDTVFLFSYAVGLFFSGAIGDRFELRKVLAIGMWLSGVVIFLFGTLTEWLGFYNKIYYLIIWSLNGLFQSSGWPCVVAIVGNWFGKQSRGLLFGVWSSCSAVGNIIGSLIAGCLIDYGYEIVFLYASTTLIGGGFIAFFGIVNSPSELGLENPNAPEMQPIMDCDPETSPSCNQARDELVDYDDDNGSVLEDDHAVLLSNDTKTKPINFCTAFLLPGVISYALVFAAVKMINYSFGFWLPYYLTNNFGWSDTTAAQLSIWYDIGSIGGGIIFGLLSDWLERRSPVLFFMMLAAPFAIWGYQVSPPNQLINGVLMTVLGFFIGGASNIIGTAVTTDIGKQPAIGANTDALSTVTGIIDGTGSMGAGLGQFLVTFIQSRVGWAWVFYSFIIECGIVLICLISPLANDLKTWNIRGSLSRAFGRRLPSTQE